MKPQERHDAIFRSYAITSWKVTLLAFASHMDDDNRNARPGVATICRFTGMKERRTRQVLRDMEKAGVIVRKYRGPKSPPWTEIDFDALQRLPPPAKTARGGKRCQGSKDCHGEGSKDCHGEGSKDCQGRVAKTAPDPLSRSAQYDPHREDLAPSEASPADAGATHHQEPEHGQQQDEDPRDVPALDGAPVGEHEPSVPDGGPEGAAGVPAEPGPVGDGEGAAGTRDAPEPALTPAERAKMAEASRIQRVWQEHRRHADGADDCPKTYKTKIRGCLRKTRETTNTKGDAAVEILCRVVTWHHTHPESWWRRKAEEEGAGTRGASVVFKQDSIPARIEKSGAARHNGTKPGKVNASIQIPPEVLDYRKHVRKVNLGQVPADILDEWARQDRERDWRVPA